MFILDRSKCMTKLILSVAVIASVSIMDVECRGGHGGHGGRSSGHGSSHGSGGHSSSGHSYSSGHGSTSYGGSSHSSHSYGSPSYSGSSHSYDSPSYGWSSHVYGSPSASGSSHSFGNPSYSTSSQSFKANAPIGPPQSTKPVGALSPGAPHLVHPPPYSPHNPGVPPPAYSPSNNPAGYGPPPAYNPAAPQPPYHAVAYGHMTSSQHQKFDSEGTSNINVVHNYNHVNMHHSDDLASYGGSTTYQYTQEDTGRTDLGFYLGHALGKMSTPTYHYHSGFYDGYTPKYDHYEVHHYYHNRESIPTESTIQPSTIVGCIGDSGTICPNGTVSLCTNNGAILCVISADSTIPCKDEMGQNCIQTTIPCLNGLECNDAKNKNLNIPCISKAQVPGNVTYVNNTVVFNNVSANEEVKTTTTARIDTTTWKNPFADFEYYQPAFNHREEEEDKGKKCTITYTEIAQGSNKDVMDKIIRGCTIEEPNLGNLFEDNRFKREIPVAEVVNNFCVVVLALPAKRKYTEQEQLLEKGTSFFSKFLVKALGAQ